VEHYFGAHTIDTGGIHMAARRAANAGMRALQIFSAIPKYYNDRVSVKPERAARFRETLAATQIAPERVVVHGAYVLNVATPDEAKWIRARDREAAAERIATAIVHALETVKGGTRLLVENTAGAGTTMARTAEEVGAILRHVPKRLRDRTGYGLDTCHLYASGYDLRESAALLRRVLDAFEEATGETPGFFHLNDSEGGLGSNRDRHMLIGDGTIGEEAFGWLLHDPRTRGVPLILETPQLNMEIAEDDDSPDPYDVQMLELLLRLEK
jgi:deoxyribonuclease-4